jgi:hypothetical protein
MLGRLRMSVTEAIEHYGALAERVFSDAKLIGGDGKFKATKLEDIIKEIVEAKTGRADELMMDPRPEGEACRTYASPKRRPCSEAYRPSALCALCLH